MVDLGRDDVALFITIEGSEAFQAQVVGFGRTRCEDDLASRGSNQVSDLVASIFASLLRFPSERVRSRVRIAETLRHVREHFVENSKEAEL